MSDSEKSISQQIKKKAKDLGFDFIGFSKVEKLENEADHLSDWLNASYHGEMDYMEDHFSKRLDPNELFKGSKSIISLLYNYYPENELNNRKYKIAKYAYGKDYHKIVMKKLNHISSHLKLIVPGIKVREFIDSAPILERQWAMKSGLGWIGKNTLLINKDKGSFFFLAELLLDIELEYDIPIKDYCGTCTKCLDACPTDAFPQPYVLDASKCIAYATIELKDEKLPELFEEKLEGWIFGCDICQDVCPWNNNSSPHMVRSFKPNDALSSMKNEDWENLNEEKYDKIFSGSAVKRSQFSGLKRNIKYVSGD